MGIPARYIIMWILTYFFYSRSYYCQAQGQGQSQSQSQKSKLDPEVGVVMGWPTHHPPTTHHHQATFFSLKLLIKAR